MPNYLMELIVLRLCSVVLILFSIVLAPILRYDEVVFGAQPPPLPIVNYSRSVGFQYCAQLCSNPFRSYSPFFRDLGILFQYTCSRSTTGVRLPLPHCEFWSRNRLNQLGFICALLCSSNPSIVLASFPGFRHLLMYAWGQWPKFEMLSLSLSFHLFVSVCVPVCLLSFSLSLSLTHTYTHTYTSPFTCL